MKQVLTSWSQLITCKSQPALPKSIFLIIKHIVIVAPTILVLVICLWMILSVRLKNKIWNIDLARIKIFPITHTASWNLPLLKTGWWPMMQHKFRSKLFCGINRSAVLGLNRLTVSLWGVVCTLYRVRHWHDRYT